MDAKELHNDPAPRHWSAGPVTISELTAGLIWPMLLRAPAMALQPPRLILGAAAAILLWAAASLLDALRAVGGSPPTALPFISGIRDAWLQAGHAAIRLDPQGAARELYSGEIRATLELVTDRPMALLLVLLVLGPLWAILSAAVARSVAVDIAFNRDMGPFESLRFALSRWRASAAALLMPVAMVIFPVIILAAAGWITLALPGVSVVGGLLYGLMLLAGAGVVVWTVGFALGHSLLVPAVAVEGSDAVDAVQRVYAYLLGRPGRAITYLVLMIVQGVVVIGLASWAADAVVSLTRDLVGALLSAQRQEALFGSAAAGSTPQLIGFWESAIELLVIAFILSWAASASTILYLMLRRVCDEQDVREIWMPGMVAGTRAASVGDAQATKGD